MMYNVTLSDNVARIDETAARTAHNDGKHIYICSVRPDNTCALVLNNEYVHGDFDNLVNSVEWYNSNKNHTEYYIVNR